jgi:transcriptional antiterminator RfaH
MSCENKQHGDGLRWIVINTHPHQEQLAVTNLRRQSFSPYCPMLRKRRSHARRIEHVLRPLFPGYLFVGIDAVSTRWRPMLSTVGVRSLVRAGERLSYIESDFIANLKAREVDGVIVRPPCPYQLGQRVQITTGPFDRLIATIIDMDEKDRLVVLLDMMNQAVRVNLDSDAVMSA